MTINIVAVGGLKEKYFKDAINEYQKRLSRFCKFNILEVSEGKTSANSEGDILNLINIEGKNIIPRLKGYIIILDLGGEQLSSKELANSISNILINGNSEITFVIGGSHGLSAEVKAMAKLSLSFGRITFPHQLIRVVLTEQIYRVFMINSNSEYHK